MKSSGIKRGAVLVAGTALALGGLAVAPASADDVGQNEDVPFDFYSMTTDASTRFDGSNNTVSLVSGVADTLAGATEVRYSYEKGATPVEIAEIAINNGVAAMEWTPPGGAEGAAITDVRAEVLNAAEAVLATVVRPVSANDVPGMQDNHAIELGGALRSRIGMGPDNEVVISGGTTVSEGDTHVQNVGPDGTGAEVSPSLANWGPPNGQGIAPFKVAVPIDATNNPTAGDDEIVIRGRTSDAGVVGNSDDVNVYTMYTQTVQNVALAVNPAFPAQVQLGGANDQSRYVITVTDQEGQPINGLDVFEVENTAANAPADGSGNATPDTNETNVNGQAVVALNEATIDNAQDNDGIADQQTAYYVVDVNQDGNYDDGLDWRFQLVQTGIVPVASTVELSSSKGNVLDDDEQTIITATV
jgi:hypothetical protein